MNPEKHSAAVALRAVTRALRVVRPEERLLLCGWLVGLLLIAASDTGGGDYRVVFRQYVLFFTRYLILLFALTRLLFWADERWQPRRVWWRRIKAWVFGAAPDAPRTLADRWLLRNGPQLHAAARPTVLGVDVEFTRCALLLFVNLTIYTNIKARIPFINGTVGDSLFEDMDHMLFGEGFIRAIEQWFANDAGVADYFSRLYHHGYIWMVLLVTILYLRRDTFAIRWTIVSVCLVYLTGILVTVAFPSYGPCFMDPDRFEWLRDTQAGKTQAWLAFYYTQSIERVNISGDLNASAFAGIAAFPSLHVAHMAVMLLIARRTVPLYALWMVWMTIGTFIATIGFGWHYAVDALGGVALAVGFTEGMYVLMRRWDCDRARYGGGA